MQNNSKHSPTPTKPSPNPSAMPSTPGNAPQDQEDGEGSYSATRDYQKSVKNYLATADVEKDARDAAPDNAADARDMEKAEEAGRKHAKKQGNTKDE